MRPNKLSLFYFTTPNTFTTTMEATLGLRIPPLTALKKPHCRLYKPNTISGHHRRRLSSLASNAAAATPFVYECGRRAEVVNVRGLGVRACGLASRDGDGEEEKASGGRAKPKGMAVGAAAAAVACVMGVLCTRQAVLARAAPGWPWSSSTPPAQQSELRAELRQLLDILDEAESKMKERPSFKSMNDKADSTSLINEWKTNKEGPLQKHELGLSLIEILINRGEYEKARDICNDMIEGSEKDGRLPLRKFIINASMQLESSMRRRDLEQIVDAAKKDWEDYLQKYGLWSSPPQIPIK